ncbi:hypothetical protein [Ammoniphilus sp. YIM 78166]|uniref:hypothetical protein n=1 Tax=Ammoniphilus sp. YIM 78166 TaxID=1644106 RepID=UPI00106F737B|nr:hypothetical protein [Ammoniphilus sp. YIM 78166]
MIRAFRVSLNEENIQVFVSKIDYDVYKSVHRQKEHGWLVSIPQWNWSTFVKEGTKSLDDPRFWISQLSSAYTDDEDGIHSVAEAIARKC